MQPMFFVGHNHVFSPPQNWNTAEKGDCHPLPVMVDAEGLTSVWKPSADELATLNAGGGIMISMTTHQQPVMGVGVCAAESLLVSA